MKLKDIKRIMKENEKYAKMLEEYDKTGKLPLEKTRRIKKNRKEHVQDSGRTG